MHETYTRATMKSLFGHGAIIFLALVIPWLRGCFTHEEIIIPLDMTVVIEENLAPPDDKDEPEEDVPEQPPPEPKAVKPIPPPDPPPVVDAVEVEKKKPEKPKPPEKKPPEKPIPPKPLDKPKAPDKPKEPDKPKPPEKKPFVKGKRITTPGADPKKYNPKKAATERALSKDEIARLLNAGARPGNANQVADNEASRCFFLIRKAMYDAWDQPSDNGLRAVMEIRLDLSGRVVSYRLIKGSGNAFYDQSVLRAAAGVSRIGGLSTTFLRKYEKVTVEFMVD